MALPRTICVILFLWLIIGDFQNTVTEENPTALLYVAKDFLRPPDLPQARRLKRSTTSPSAHIVVQNALTLFQRSSLAIMLVLLANDVEVNPGSADSGVQHLANNNSSLNCILLNARSLKSMHTQYENQTAKISTNIARLQNLLCSEETDVVFVTETWITTDIQTTEILPTDFTAFRKDRESSRGDGVLLVAVKTDLFKAIKEVDIPNNVLELVSAEVTTIKNSKILNFLLVLQTSKCRSDMA